MYTEKLLSRTQFGAGAADVLTSTGVHSYTYLIFSPMVVRRIMVLITTATVLDTLPAVVTFRKRPTPASATGQSVIGTVSVPTAMPVGNIIYKEVSPVTLNPGTEVCFDVTTAGTAAAGAAGGCLYDFESDGRPEVPANLSNMVASA